MSNVSIQNGGRKRSEVLKRYKVKWNEHLHSLNLQCKIKCCNWLYFGTKDTNVNLTQFYNVVKHQNILCHHFLLSGRKTIFFAFVLFFWPLEWGITRENLPFKSCTNLSL